MSRSKAWLVHRWFVLLVTVSLSAAQGLQGACAADGSGSGGGGVKRMMAAAGEPPAPDPPAPPQVEPREVPLPYKLQDKPPPRGYVALRAPTAPKIDGVLDDPVWANTPWTEELVDIVGPTGPAAWAPAAVKMAWDKQALYVAARLKDESLFANKTAHDSIVYHDNNFEIFLDPDGDNHEYVEIEINGIGTAWDLWLTRPYRNGGTPIMSFETIPPAVQTQQDGPTGWSPMRHAISVDGRINDASGTRSWTVEVALPWTLLRQAAGGRRVPPRGGDAWRINFSRVMWTVKWDPSLKKYVKDPPEQEPFNFVWSPQYQVAMHQPETWGYLQFEDVEAKPGVKAPPLEGDPTWPARAYLMELYTAQHAFWEEHQAFANSLKELGVSPPVNITAVQDVRLSTTEEGRIVTTWPGGDGRLAYRPAEGTSRFC